MLVPDGDSELQADDIVTGFGAPGARSQVLERLRATSDDAAATGRTLPIDRRSLGQASDQEPAKPPPNPGVAAPRLGANAAAMDAFE